MPDNQKPNRKQQILECLAHMLETSPGQRITTAKLAEQVGFSEAALYRHFPSKARMFEGLIDYIEEALFSRINMILSEHKESVTRCSYMTHLILVFAERNPGMCRILAGDALVGENERLRVRIHQLFEKIETQFKQIIRERKLREGKSFSINETALANIMLAFCEGKISQYVRSGFDKKPSEGFNEQWQFLINNV